MLLNAAIANNVFKQLHVPVGVRACVRDVSKHLTSRKCFYAKKKKNLFFFLGVLSAVDFFIIPQGSDIIFFTDTDDESMRLKCFLFVLRGSSKQHRGVRGSLWSGRLSPRQGSRHLSGSRLWHVSACSSTTSAKISLGICYQFTQADFTKEGFEFSLSPLVWEIKLRHTDLFTNLKKKKKSLNKQQGQSVCCAQKIVCAQILQKHFYFKKRLWF